MTRSVYRVCRARYARLDGEGARLVGGRWNSPGRAVAYMAESVVLAILENLVHMPRQDFRSGYVCVAAVLPDGMNIATEQEARRFWTQLV
jgi:RES domain-containing protein